MAYFSDPVVPWIAVDLDGTLAVYDHWRGPTHIGDPVPKMLARVKDWLARGQKVKIFTARVNRDGRRLAECLQVEEVIRNWCQKYFGQVLEMTCKKDYACVEIWDDRAVQVVPNTGERVDGVVE